MTNSGNLLFRHRENLDDQRKSLCQFQKPFKKCNKKKFVLFRSNFFIFGAKIEMFYLLQIVWKLLKMSHLKFRILAFSTNFCPIKTDLSGNTVWPQASGILSGQKLIKNANFPFWRVFENLEACGQTVLLDRTKIGGKCQNSKIQMRHFE